MLGAALTADGRWAISGSHDDLTLRVWDLASGTCLTVVRRQGPTSPRPVALSPDGRYLLTGEYSAIGQWVLDWDYLFPEPIDWDEGARPHLESFIALHTPAPGGPFQRPRPAWGEADFQQLLAELALRGYGWLRPEGVRRKLEEMARERR